MISFAKWLNENNQEADEFLSMIIESKGTLNEGIVKDFWEKYKKRIKYGTLGAVAVAALLTYGIPLNSILPYIAMGVTNSAIYQAMNDIVNPNNPSQKMDLLKSLQSDEKQSAPLRIVTDEKNVYIQSPQGNLKPASLNDLSQAVSNHSGSGEDIIVYRTDSSRPSIEMEVKNILDNVAGEKNWHFSNYLQPAINPMPDQDHWQPDFNN